MVASESYISDLSVRLVDLSKFPDVFQALLRNVPLVAQDIREHYLSETSNFAEELKTYLLSGPGISPLGRSVAKILEDLLDRTVAALDGGQGFGILGSTTPFMIRTVTYSIRLGSRSADRERIRTDPLLMNRIKGGAFGTLAPDFLGFPVLYL